MYNVQCLQFINDEMHACMSNVNTQKINISKSQLRQYYQASLYGIKNNIKCKLLFDCSTESHAD